MSACEKTFNFSRGDGHTIGPSWSVCARREGHEGGCATSWGMSDAQRAEDKAAARADGAKFMAFIQNTARQHARRVAAHAAIEAGLSAHPDEPFTITVEVVP